jgi:hypothetical protein
MRRLIAAALVLAGLSGTADAACYVPTWRMVWDTEGIIYMQMDGGGTCRTSFSRVWNTSEIHAVSIKSAPRNGSASAGGRGVTYRPRAGFKGEDSFMFLVTGRKAGAAQRATMRVNVTVR